MNTGAFGVVLLTSTLACAVTTIGIYVIGKWVLVENLIRQDKLVELQYDGKRFYLKRIAMPKAQRE